ncbi:hypothetical protein ACJQWK_07128 [Exserohilum turcicum]
MSANLPTGAAHPSHPILPLFTATPTRRSSAPPSHDTPVPATTARSEFTCKAPVVNEPRPPYPHHNGAQRTRPQPSKTSLTRLSGLVPCNLRVPSLLGNSSQIARSHRPRLANGAKAKQSPTSRKSCKSRQGNRSVGERETVILPLHTRPRCMPHPMRDPVRNPVRDPMRRFVPSVCARLSSCLGVSWFQNTSAGTNPSVLAVTRQSSR